MLKKTAAPFAILAIAALPLLHDPWLFLLALATIWVGFSLLWHLDASRMLVFLFSFQWLQVVAKLLQASIANTSVDAIWIESSYGWQRPADGSTSIAIALSLIALCALAVGIRLGAGSYRIRYSATEFLSLPQERVVKYALISYLAFAIAAVLTDFVPGGLRQYVGKFLQFKYLALFIFVGFAFAKRRFRLVVVGILAVEILLGFTRYFAAWKISLYIVILAILYTTPQLTTRQIFRLAAVGGVVMAAALVWTAIKPEQRAFLNEGSGQQVVVVGISDGLKNSIDLATALDGSAYINAWHDLLNRIAYVDFFANAINYVPEVAPHQNGKLVSKAVLHILTPRILFPNKPRLESDSELTMRYTGLRLASEEHGTSISLGYVAELYVDFGPFWMHGFVFLIGLIIGLAFRAVASLKVPLYISAGTVVVLLLNIHIFEISLVKLLGSLLTALIVQYFTIRFLFDTRTGLMPLSTRLHSTQQSGSQGAAG